MDGRRVAAAQDGVHCRCGCHVVAVDAGGAMGRVEEVEGGKACAAAGAGEEEGE